MKSEKIATELKELPKKDPKRDHRKFKLKRLNAK